MGNKKKGSEGGKEGADEVMKEAGEEEGGAKQGGGTKCSRCTKRGHVATNCEIKLFCVICSAHDHVNHRCPLLKETRPVAHAVGYAVHGLGFYHIPHPPLPRSKKVEGVQICYDFSGRRGVNQGTGSFSAAEDFSREVDLGFDGTRGKCFHNQVSV